MAKCTLCLKRAVSGSLVSHSQIHTKRKFKPNLQKIDGVILCTKCLKTIRRENKNTRDLKSIVKEGVGEANKE
jgi:ribosomal protein L28